MIKMEDCDVDGDDRPLFPPKIKETEVRLQSVCIAFLIVYKAHCEYSGFCKKLGICLLL